MSLPTLAWRRNCADGPLLSPFLKSPSMVPDKILRKTSIPGLVRLRGRFRGVSVRTSPTCSAGRRRDGASAAGVPLAGVCSGGLFGDLNGRMSGIGDGKLFRRSTSSAAVWSRNSEGGPTSDT